MITTADIDVEPRKEEFNGSTVVTGATVMCRGHDIRASYELLTTNRQPIFLLSSLKHINDHSVETISDFIRCASNQLEDLSGGIVFLRDGIETKYGLCVSNCRNFIQVTPESESVTNQYVDEQDVLKDADTFEMPDSVDVLAEREGPTQHGISHTDVHVMDSRGNTHRVRFLTPREDVFIRRSVKTPYTIISEDVLRNMKVALKSATSWVDEQRDVDVKTQRDAMFTLREVAPDEDFVNRL